MSSQTIVALLLSVAVLSCATSTSRPIVAEATPETYAAAALTKGTVILAINWSRLWNCDRFKSAEIVSMGFDRLPISDVTSESPPEVFIDEPSRMMRKPALLDYALLLNPGEYALTSYEIRAVRLARGTRYFRANRSRLIEHGAPRAGSFEVKAGEIVYIGDFFVDCQQDPVLWRYYTKGRESFRSHMNRVQQKYPFIDPDQVTYRLFQTTNHGREYHLPE